MRKYLRTIDLAKAVGLSVQQVRNYEDCGFLPPVERNEQGYRLYTVDHLKALETVRSMIRGYGWQQALEIMRAVQRGDVPAALSLVDARHAAIDHERGQVTRTLEALQVVASRPVPRPRVRPSQGLRVSEAARRVGVRVSALRFWEEQGLLHPIRQQGSSYRLYDDQQMHQLQVVVLLREVGYGFDVIRQVLGELTSGRPEKAVEAVEKRREELARASWACMEATIAFGNYIRELQNN